MDVTRRNFLLSTTAAAAGVTLAGQTPGAGAQAPTLVAQAAAHPAPRGFNPADPALKFDIVIANGDVLDPSQKLHGKRDIGVKFGQIAAIAPSLPADRAVQRIDAAGKLVTPGLVDLHTHLVPHRRATQDGRPSGRSVTTRCRSRARVSSPSSTSPPSAWPVGSRRARC